MTPLRRQIVFTEPIDGLPDELPMTIDFASSFYFHREGPGLLMGMSYAGQEPGFSTEQTDDWLPDLAGRDGARGAVGGATPASRAAGAACTRSAPTTTR